MQDKKFCSICGKANDINNTFCNFCFSKFDDSPVDINIDSNKDSAFEKYQEGVTFWNANKFEDAIKLFEEVLKINPQCKQVWNKEKGICLHNLSRFDESVECFKKVLIKLIKFAFIYFKNYRQMVAIFYPLDIINNFQLFSNVRSGKHMVYMEPSIKFFLVEMCIF